MNISVLGKNSIIYGFGTIITRFIHLLLLPFFTTYLSPEDYGILAMLTFMGQILQPIFSLGLGAGMGPCYFEGNNEETKSTVVWSAFILLFLSNIILLVSGTLFSKQLSNLLFHSPKYLNLVILSLFSTVLNNLKIPFAHRIQFEGKSKPFVYITVVISISTILINVIFVIFLGYGVIGMLIGQLVGASFGLFLLIYYVIRWTKIHLKISMMRSLLRLGLPLVPSFAFLFILMNSNKYLLQWFSGLDALGVYSVGFSFGVFMSIFTGAFQTAWFPFFMSFMNKPSDTKLLFGRIFNYYVIIFGSLTLLFFIFARIVVTVMTQPPFHGAYRIIGFTALAHFFIGLYSLLLPPIYYIKKVKVQSIIQGITCIPHIIIVILLIGRYEALGAAIGLSIGFFLMIWVTWIWIRFRKIYLKINYNFNRIISFFIYAILVIITCSFERNWNWKNELIFILLNLISLIIFIIIWSNTYEKKYTINFIKKILKK